MKNFVRSEEIEVIDLKNGTTRKVLSSEGSIMPVEVAVEEGAAVPMHSHPHEQISYVLEGEFQFTVGDQVMVLKTGDVVYQEANVVHGVLCLKKGRLLDVFTPIREDFLAKKFY